MLLFQSDMMEILISSALNTNSSNQNTFNLQDQITPVLIAFAASGAVLSFFELLGVILACNLATVMKEQNAEKKRMARITQLKVKQANCLSNIYMNDFI